MCPKMLHDDNYHQLAKDPAEFLQPLKLDAESRGESLFAASLRPFERPFGLDKRGALFPGKSVENPCHPDIYLGARSRNRKKNIEIFLTRLNYR